MVRNATLPSPTGALQHVPSIFVPIPVLDAQVESVLMALIGVCLLNHGVGFLKGLSLPST